MTTSEAIIWFEHRKAGATMPGARMAYDMAIEALREKSGRDQTHILCGFKGDTRGDFGRKPKEG